MTFGQRLTNLRKEHGYTKRNEFAEKLGIPSTTLRNYETDVREPGHPFLIQVSKLFGVSIDYLLGLTEEKEILHSYNIKPSEYKHIEKYRSIDDYSRATIDYLLDREVERSNYAAVVKDPPPAYGENVIPIFENITLAHRSGSAGAGTGAPADNIEVVSIDYPADLVPPGTDYTINVSGDSMEPTYYDGDILFCQRTNSLDYGDIGIFILNGETLVKEYGEDGLVSHNGKYDVIKIGADASLRVEGKVLGKL